MLSQRKTLLRLLELVALLATLGALYFGIKTFREPSPDFPVLLAGVAGMALGMATFLPACMLGGEYVKTVRRPDTWRQRTAGLNKTELAAVLRWAPTPYLAIAALGIVILVAAALKFGSIEFRSDEAPDPSKIPGLFFYYSVFYALALPVLASASRMPGTYADQGDA